MTEQLKTPPSDVVLTSATSDPVVTSTPPATPSPKRYQFWEAFKNFAILFSFAVNFILILVLLLMPVPLFRAKGEIVQPLLGDLDNAFAALGETKIKSIVHIEDTIPVVFDLPLAQNTNVVLVSPVPLQAPATFQLPGGGGSINGTVSLQLPEGMALPVSLNLVVPVSTTIPVVMQVPVEIPLAEAGMAPAITQLREVFRPLREFLISLPNSIGEIFTPKQ